MVRNPTGSLKVSSASSDFDIPLAPMRPSRPAGGPMPPAPIATQSAAAAAPRTRRAPGATIPPTPASRAASQREQTRETARETARETVRESAKESDGSAAPAGRLTEAFINQNAMVERYLTGQLSPKWTQEFERYCREHPRFLTETGIHKRLQAGMDLLVATGQAPAPAKRLSRFHQLHIGWLLTAVVVLGGSLWATITWSSSLADQIALLRRQANNRTLPLPTSEREIRLLPSRDGVMTSPAIVIANRAAQMLDFQIDETRSPYKIFKVTIDRVDQGRVQVISGLQKDPEGHLLINLNSGALGPGNYQLTIEGFTPKGDIEPDSWVTIGIAPVK